jgi:hypothetical protein
MSKLKKTKNKSLRNIVSPPVVGPTSEEIAVVAYAIWEQEGRPDGRDVDHWLRAETQIRHNSTQSN